MFRFLESLLTEGVYQKLNYKIILISVLCLLMTTSIFAKSIKDNDDNNNLNLKLADLQSDIKKDTTAYRVNKEIFIDVLIQANIARTSWIARKEIAAWSATLLYFAIISSLAGIFHKTKLSMKQKRIISIFLIMTLLLFSFFVHQQIGQLVSDASFQTASSKYIFKTIENNSIPIEFNFTSDSLSGFPKSINDEATASLKEIRKFHIFLKPFIPIIYSYQKIIGKRNITHIEVQESILYDMMLIATFFCFFVLYAKKPTSKRVHKKFRRFIR